MAYQEHTQERSGQRRRSHPETASPRKRRRRQRQIRFDWIVLVFVVVVLMVIMSMPQHPQNTNPTDDITMNQQTQPTQTTLPPVTEPPATVPPTTAPPPTEPPKPLTFTAEDRSLIYVRSISRSGGGANSEQVEKALLAELDWDLRDPSVTVLIIHSHISESYTLNSDQVPNEGSSFISDPYRTDDERYNMVAIGNRVAEILRANGIKVIHETKTFEIPNSDYAYNKAREYLEDTLKEHPEICLILDLHRDAVPDPNDPEKQWAPTVTVDGKESAKISMLIGYYNSRDRIWNDNLSFAVKLGAQLNHNEPKTFRQLLVNDHKNRYNQDLGPVSMLIEVGTAGNSLEEALNGAELLGEALVDLALGANLE